jgi:hypothetical protein
MGALLFVPPLTCIVLLASNDKMYSGRAFVQRSHLVLYNGRVFPL